MEYYVKEASFEDLPNVARIHVRSWQQTYIGLVPQDYLDGMDIPTRQKKWEEISQGKTVEDKNLYIAYDNGQAVGFISFGRARDKRKEGCGEIYAIYLLKESWNKGIGYALFEQAQKNFQNTGIISVYVWVLNTNTNAIRSYEKWGGVIDSAFLKEDSIGGQPVKEIMMNFDLSN